jgi:RHS repeat-associated protein
MLSKCRSIFIILFFVSNMSSAQNELISYEPWQHPVIKALEQKKANYIVFTHKDDGNYYVPVVALNTDNNRLYYISTFGLIHDSVVIGPKLFQLLVSKNIDPFLLYAKIVTKETFSEIQQMKARVRKYGVRAKLPSPKETFLNYTHVNTCNSSFEKIILLDEAEQSTLQNYLLTNLTFNIPDNSDFRLKLNDWQNYKSARIYFHKNDTEEYFEYSNSNRFSSLSKAIFFPKTCKVFMYSQLGIVVDSFIIKSDKVEQLKNEKIDIFALYRMRLEWELEFAERLLDGLLKVNRNKLTSNSDRNIQKQNLAVAHELTQKLSKRIHFAVAPDNDLLLIYLLEQEKQNARKKWVKGKGWEMLLPPNSVDGEIRTYTRGNKEYYLSDYRGNVMATISDIKIPHSSDGVTVDFYTADLITATDYYPFGSIIKSRTYRRDTKNPRYGFNGKENDNEVKGEGNQQDYGMRIYDPRLGRFLSTDPITGEYPELTPYQFASNTPIQAIDLDGLEGAIASPMGGQNVVDAQTAKDFNAAKSWFSQPASRWMKLGLAAQMNAIQTTEVYTENSFPKMTKGQYLAASMAQAQINNSQSSRSFSSRSARVPQKPHAEVKTDEAKPKLKVGTYEDMKKANAGMGLSADHIPSFAALKADAERQLGRQLTSVEAKTLRSQSLTIVYETQIHQTTSRTYGGRNNRQQIQQDASNLYEAVKKDIDALKPGLIKAGFSEQEINEASSKLLAPYKPKQ